MRRRPVGAGKAAPPSLPEDPIADIRMVDFLREMPVLLDAFDRRGLIGFWNRECERVTGYSAKEMVNNPRALETLYPDPVYRADLMANCQDRGYAQVWCLTAKDGQARSIAWTNIPTKTGRWEWGFGVDLTERIRLTAALDDVAERERNRLGQELHDGLGQTLTGLSLMLKGLSERPALRSRSVATELKQIAHFASGAVRSCREIASGLMPTHEGGLSGALQHLVREVQLQHPQVQIAFEDERRQEMRISSTTHAHLYRIVQEALNNAIRHSGGDQIRVICRTGADLITLLVQDNGRGIPAASRIRSGLGMRTLRDRAAAVNALLVVAPLSSGGTQVRVECPNCGVGPLQ